MDQTPLTLELRPLHQGAYSQITLKGPVATVPQALQVRRLMSVLWLWHGSPVDVVLCVDGTNTGACWLEVWEDVLGRVQGVAVKNGVHQGLVDRQVDAEDIAPRPV